MWITELGNASRRSARSRPRPLYYNGMIYIGPVGSEYGVRGFMAAFNAKTGEMVWKHCNIPAPGEMGHE